MDRQGAEIDYMKKYGRAWKAAGGDQDPAKNNPSDDFQQLHPRYATLIESKNRAVSRGFAVVVLHSDGRIVTACTLVLLVLNLSWALLIELL